MQRPTKTSRTSSKPPATDRKERREQSKPGGAKPGHEGRSRVMCDEPGAVETGVRIEGSNAYHWVFHSAEAVVHQASPTRGAVVVREMVDGHRPAVWISDRYTAQQGHAVAHQTCLAHLARDVAYVVEISDDPVPWRLQLWLRSVFALAEHVTDLATSTLAAKGRSLDRQLSAILATPSRCAARRRWRSEPPASSR